MVEPQEALIVDVPTIKVFPIAAELPSNSFKASNSMTSRGELSHWPHFYLLFVHFNILYVI